MNLLSRIVILLISLCLLILITLPLALNSSALKFQIEQKISKKYNSNFEIKGAVDVALFPFPKITINNANFNNLEYKDDPITLAISEISVRVAVGSLFSDRIKINKLSLSNPIIKVNYSEPADEVEKLEGEGGATALDSISNENEVEIEDEPTIGADDDTLLNKIFYLKEMENDHLEMSDIKLIEVFRGGISKYDFNGQKELEFTDISFEIMNDRDDQNFTIEGDFVSEEVPTSFNVDINTNAGEDSRIVITSPIIAVDLQGQFDRSQISNLKKANFSGKFKTEIIDLKTVINKYFSKTSLISRNISSLKPIQVSADIDSVNGEIKVRDIIINSELINGTGRMDADFSRKMPVMDISMMIDDMNLDKLWVVGSVTDKSATKEKMAVRKLVNDSKSLPQSAENNLKNKVKSSNKKQPPNLDLTAEIKIKDAKYLQQELKNIDIYLILSGNGDILLQPLTGRIPGDGIIRIAGAFEQDNDISKFIGDVDIVGDNLEQFLDWLKIKPSNLRSDNLTNYRLSSDVLVLPNFMVLGNLYGSINNGKNLLFGDIKLDRTSGIYDVKSNFRVSDLALEDYFLVDSYDKYLFGGSLLSKLLWLNTVDAHYNISLNFDRLSFFGQVFLEQEVSLKFGQGYIALDDFNYELNDNKVKASISINIVNQDPYIDIVFDADKLHYDSQKFAANEDQELPDGKSSKSLIESENRPTFIDQFFNLTSLKSFNGRLDLDVREINIDNFEINNFKIFSKIKDGDLNLEDFEAKIYDGLIKYDGLISFGNSKLINGSFKLVEVNNKKLLSNLLKIDNVGGVSNISGAINSIATNKNAFFKNLETKMNFVSAHIVIDRFGLDDLTAKTANPFVYKDELSNPKAILFNDNYKSYIKEAKGSLEIQRGGRKNQLIIETKSVGINGINKGAVNFANNNFNGVTNFIFLTGTKDRQIPINIAVAYQGKSGNLKKEADVNQVKQYLKLVTSQQ